MKPIKDDMCFWHAVWISAGKPQNTELHKVYQHLRRKYHYAIRKVKRQENEIKKQKMMQQCVTGKVNDILTELKHQRNPKGSVVTKMDHVEGAQQSVNTSNHFTKWFITITAKMENLIQ